jgi:hypothetical protein
LFDEEKKKYLGTQKSVVIVQPPHGTMYGKNQHKEFSMEQVMQITGLSETAVKAALEFSSP